MDLIQIWNSYCILKKIFVKDFMFEKKLRFFSNF